MRRYPVFRVPTEAPEPTSGEVANPQVGPIGAEDPGAPTINIKKRQQWAPGGAEAGDPRAPTINAKKHQ
jgi:hypothetical protein